MVLVKQYVLINMRPQSALDPLSICVSRWFLCVDGYISYVRVSGGGCGAVWGGVLVFLIKFRGKFALSVCVSVCIACKVRDLRCVCVGVCETKAPSTPESERANPQLCYTHTHSMNEGMHGPCASAHACSFIYHTRHAGAALWCVHNWQRTTHITITITATAITTTCPECDG